MTTQNDTTTTTTTTTSAAASDSTTTRAKRTASGDTGSGITATTVAVTRTGKAGDAINDLDATIASTRHLLENLDAATVAAAHGATDAVAAFMAAESSARQWSAIAAENGITIGGEALKRLTMVRDTGLDSVNAARDRLNAFCRALSTMLGAGLGIVPQRKPSEKTRDWTTRAAAIIGDAVKAQNAERAIRTLGK